MYDEHPAATIFPMLPESDLLDLAEDIEKRGLNHAIIIHEGLVLDGRNRLAACELVDVEPTFEEWDGRGGTPTQFVISENLHRRHLTTSQRAAIAAEVLPQLEQEAKERQGGDGRFGSSSIDEEPSDVSQPQGNGLSSEHAAEMFNVGAPTVQRAKAVRLAEPEEFERIKRGETTVNGAYKKLSKPEPKKEPVAITTDRKRSRAEAHKRRMVNGLSTIDGICKGLRELDVGMIAAVCENGEVDTWTHKAKQLSYQLKRFQKQLSETAR